MNLDGNTAATIADQALGRYEDGSERSATVAHVESRLAIAEELRRLSLAVENLASAGGSR